MSYATAPLGLVPKFLRPATTAPADGRRATEDPVEPCKPTGDVASPRPAARKRRANEQTVEEMRANQRRLHAMSSPESVARFRKLSDALGLAEGCVAGGCRRARRCQGVGGAVCIIDRRDVVLPALRLLKEQVFSGDDEGEARAEPNRKPRRPNDA